MSSCTKREMLTPVAPPTEATQESPTDAPGIYIETADGVVHNTGLRATASETREWTSPDGTVRVSGLGRYSEKKLEEDAATVSFFPNNGYNITRCGYRFEKGQRSQNPDGERLWKVFDNSGVSSDERMVFVVRNNQSGKKGVEIPEGTTDVILKPEVVLTKTLPDYAEYIRPVYYIDVVISPNGTYHYTPDKFEELYQSANEAWPGSRGIVSSPYVRPTHYRCHVEVCMIRAYPYATVEKDLDPSPFSFNPEARMGRWYRAMYAIDYTNEKGQQKKAYYRSVIRKNSPTPRWMDFTFDSSLAEKLVYDRDKSVLSQALIPELAQFLPKLKLTPQSSLKKALPIFKVRVLCHTDDSGKVRQSFHWYQLPERILSDSQY